MGLPAFSHTLEARDRTPETSAPVSHTIMGSEIVIILFAIVGSAFISLSETAVLAVNKIRMRHRSEGGDRRAARILSFSREPEKFFGTVLLANNIFNMLLGAVATSFAIRVWGNTGGVIAGAAIVATAVVTMFGELLPKTLAAVASERVALLVARPIHLLSIISFPIVWVFTLLPRLLTNLLGGREAMASPTVTQSELRMLIDVGEQEGTVERVQGAMLERVFELGETEVREIMTPRTGIAWVHADTTLGEFLENFHNQPFSRLPVYDDDYDDVVGILSMRDVTVALSAKTLNPTLPVTRMAREPLFVPETKHLDDLFHMMQQGGHRLAVVVDEYGGVAGLVTLTRVLEQIIGRTGQEGRRPEQSFVTVDENTFVVDGGMAVGDANEAMSLGLPEGEYETVAGFVLEHLQRLPSQGDRVRHAGLRLQVVEMQANRVTKVRIRKRASGPAGEPASSS